MVVLEHKSGLLFATAQCRTQSDSLIEHVLPIIFNYYVMCVCCFSIRIFVSQSIPCILFQIVQSTKYIIYELRIPQHTTHSYGLLYNQLSYTLVYYQVGLVFLHHFLNIFSLIIQTKKKE